MRIIFNDKITEDRSNADFLIFLIKKMKRINFSESFQLREVIEKAIEDHIITRKEYDNIIDLASRDGEIDRMEQALLSELQGMIADGMVKFSKG
jgi:hypothetical protein